MKMKESFKSEVRNALGQNKVLKNELLTEADIQNLPLIVQKYIRITGSIGKEKVRNFYAEFTGGFRSNSKEKFSPLHSIQYNFYHEPTRLFYMIAKKMGIPATGLHIYIKRTASMVIKVFGLFKVTEAKGFEMNKGETVTFFNDMCFIAPATLIDKNISWKELDNTTIEAHFKNGAIDISAALYFKENGELVNFISSDRYETIDGKTYNNFPWLTPVTEYSKINDYYLPSAAKVIYRHPDEDFCYGEFKLLNIEYNVSDYK
jgi:hypothetical protein